jgi:hypothetical protein
MGYSARVLFSQRIMLIISVNLSRKLADTSSEGEMKHLISNLEFVI